MKPASYRPQDSCVNCGHAHLFHPSQDDGPMVICLHGGEIFPEYPKMLEFNFDNHMVYVIERDEFTEPREVCQNAICDKWVDVDKKTDLATT